MEQLITEEPRDKTEEPGDEGRTPALGMDRRRFMVRAAALGLTAAALPAFLAACAQMEEAEALPAAVPPAKLFPAPTPFSAGAVRPAPTAAASPTATAASTPTAEAALPAVPATSAPATSTPAPAATAQPAAASPAPTVAPTPALAASPTVPAPAAALRHTAAPTTPAATPAAGTPTPAPVPLLAGEGARISRLVWRAGFGASPQELEGFRAMGLPKAIDHLVDFETVDDSALERRLDAQDFDL